MANLHEQQDGSRPPPDCPFVIRSADHADLITWPPVMTDLRYGRDRLLPQARWRKDRRGSRRRPGEIDTRGETTRWHDTPSAVPGGPALEWPHGDGGVILQTGRSTGIPRHRADEPWIFRRGCGHHGPLGWDGSRPAGSSILLIPAFGTNEGYAPKSRLQNYESPLEKRIDASSRRHPTPDRLVSGPDAN
jgi:hypothetical protein